MNAPKTQSETVTSLGRTRQASLGEVIQRLVEIHAQLAAHYSRMALRVPGDRFGLVLTYLAGHEMSLVDYLQQFLNDVPETVRDRRFKYVPDLAGADLFERLIQQPTTDLDALAERLQEIHHAIDAVYEPLDGNLLPEELAEVVDKLRLQEKEHLIAQLRAINDE